jgi:ubiquitin C-terminal hydrolase
LIIQLKRFNVDHFKGINKKINTTVTYESKLNLLIADKPVTYLLYGVILHFGSLENGHYMGLGKRNEAWLEFNDENVT